jgi:hypothetical protein
MIESNENQRNDKRAQIHQKGKARFIKRHGILFFGVPMTIVFLLSNIFLINPGLEVSGSAFPKLMSIIGVAVAGGLASGYFFGLFMWHFHIKPTNRQS